MLHNTESVLLAKAYHQHVVRTKEVVVCNEQQLHDIFESIDVVVDIDVLVAFFPDGECLDFGECCEAFVKIREMQNSEIPRTEPTVDATSAAEILGIPIDEISKPETRRQSLYEDAQGGTDDSDDDALLPMINTRAEEQQRKVGRRPSNPKLTALPFSAQRKGGTVVSSGATSVLAGSIHSEVLALKSKRSRALGEERIQTPLPLPNFISRRRAECLAAAEEKKVAESKPTIEDRPMSRSNQQPPGRSVRRTTPTVRRPSVTLTPHQMVSPSGVDRQSIMRTVASRERPKSQMESRSLSSPVLQLSSIPQYSPSGPIRAVPAARIVRRIIEETERSDADRILRAIEVEAKDMTFTGSERAKLKSPYLSVIKGTRV